MNDTVQNQVSTFLGWSELRKAVNVNVTYKGNPTSPCNSSRRQCRVYTLVTQIASPDMYR